MSAVFLKLLNLSITASWLILVVILVRFLLKKAPKWISCVLWALVAVRLVCPFSLESVLSLVPSSETIPSNIEMMQKPAIDSGIAVINEAVNPAITHSFAPNPMASANPLQIVIPMLSIVWIVGMTAMLLYALISYIRLKKSVGASVPVRDNIFACDEVKSPFILGIIKPLIYVPSSMTGATLDYVITHETAHIKRHDHWWKPFGFLLLTVYWFNPLCWLAYVLLCRDIEMACDEKVIRDMDKGSVAAYSQALLDCSFPRRRIAVCPLAFGEVGVKERVKSVLNYKKPAFWVIVLAVIACVVVAVCFLTNPKNYSEEIQVNGQIYLRQENEVETLPTGSYELGRLLSILHRTKEHPSEDFSATNLNEKYAGNMLYQSGRDASTIYLEDLSGFYIPFAVVESTPGEVTFEAEVLEIHDGYFLVAPEASWALNSADRIEVPMMSMAPAPEPQVGDIIEITCSGEILETYPARLSKVYGIKVAKKASTVTKWFDYLEAPNEMKRDGSIDINLTEFPDVTFRWSSGEIVAVKGNEITSLYTGMPIWSVYFCDLTGDGLPVLCSSLSFGSGIVDNRVMIYDYANGVSYSMEDRGVTDYILRQNESDGQLYVDKTAYMGGGLLSTGRLVFENDCLQVLWPEKPNGSIREITDPTDDPTFTYDTAVEKIFEDENNEYFIGGLYSQHIIVYYTDGTQEDIVTALNAGRASIVDLDKFGIRYWAEPKGDTLVQEIKKIPGNYDFDHDGISDTLEVVKYYDGSTWFEVMAKKADDSCLWKTEAHTAHAGNNSIFVCTLNGRDYILQYSPSMFQGSCDYAYTLFSLDAQGAVIPKQSASVSFDINWGAPVPMHEPFDAAKVADFMDGVNGLLANSKLVLSTDSAFEDIDPENPYDIPWWIRDKTYCSGYVYDYAKTLRENLFELEKVVNN